MNLNNWARMIHENSIQHGWWEGKRSFSQTVDLIHSEWSEALEEERAGRPILWHSCIANNPIHPCETCFECVLKAEYPKGIGCQYYTDKPEGAAVELIDGCIRILDYLVYASNGQDIFKPIANTIEKMCEPQTATAITALKDGMARDFIHLIRRLHYLTAVSGENEDSFAGNWIMCLALCFNWIKYKYDLDPEVVLAEKHAYNIKRPYKHGKLF